MIQSRGLLLRLPAPVAQIWLLLLAMFFPPSSWRFSRRGEQPQCSTFVDRYVVGLIILDKVLGCLR
jgi:hypothetical protein